MFTTLISVALFSGLAISGARAEFDINATQLTQCGSTHLTWDKTTGPYNLIVVPAADPCGNVLVDLGDHTGESMTWNTVNLAAGTQVVFSLEDSTGDEAWSANLTVGASNDTSCLAGFSSSQSAAPSSIAASLIPATTLVANPEADVNTAAETQPTVAPVPTGEPEPSPAAVPVGAVNSGSNPNGAFSMHQINAPALALSAIAAIFAVSL